MKKLTFYSLVLLGILAVTPSFAIAKEPVPTTINSNTTEPPADVKVMLNRLKEIKAMDKSNLSRADKKALRKEVKTIKATLKASNNGIYLSVGAIIIIILLLILIL